MDILKDLKKIFSHPILKKLLGSKVVKYIALIVLFVVLVKLIMMFIQKIKQKKAAAKSKEEEKKITAASLVKVFKNFRRQIPREFRRSISLYKPYIVFGEAGSGKTLLIDNYTDWKGQAYQFYPSYNLDPDLQIYLGSQVIVQEMPAALLQDKSAGARKALLSVWNKFLYKQEPVVVVVLKASAMDAISPDALRKQAQMIRGKLNLLAKARKKRVLTHIVLTHMDQVEGYQAFSKFLHHHQIPLKVEIAENTTQNDFVNCLEGYEKYLPLALTTLPAEDYNTSIQFLKKAPDHFNSVYNFMQVLTEYDPLSETPNIGELYFASNTMPSDVANPFQPEWPEGLVPTHDKYKFKHKIAAAAALLMGTAFLFACYFYEKFQWMETQESLVNFEQIPSYERQKVAAERIQQISMRKEDPILALLPSFYQGSDLAAKRRFTKIIREQYLIPSLEKYGRSENPHEKILYLLAVIYSSNKNELGEIVRQNLDKWQELLDLPRHVIEDYIANSEDTWRDFTNLQEMPYRKRTLMPVNDEHPWVVYFLQMQKVFAEYFIAPTFLQEIQKNTEVLEEAMDQVERYQLAQTIYEKLEKLERITNMRKSYEPFLVQLKMAQWIRDNNKSLQKFFRLIRDHKITIPDATNMNLRQFMDNLQAMLLQLNVPNDTYIFELENKAFRFQHKRWIELIQGSRIRILVRKFVQHNRPNTANLFFTKQQIYPDIVMNAYNDGSFLFTGKGSEARIKGRYTRDAYEKEIKPILIELEELIQKLPISKNEKSYLANFIFRETRRYASIYRKSFEKYYLSFDIKAESLGDLKIILEQMQLPASPFNDFIQVIYTNTSIEEPTNRFLRAIYYELLPFQYINSLISPKEKETFPELEKYKAILRQIQKEIEAPAEQVEEESEEEQLAKTEEQKTLEEFLDVLPAMGKLSVPIFRDEKGSFLELTQRWLVSVGIVKKWQKPFLAPINQLFLLGKKEIEDQVQDSWQKLLVPQIEPLLLQYPFNPKSEEDIDPKKLEEVLHPTKGTFWTLFRDFIAPMLKQSRNGTWLPLITSKGKLRMPLQMLRTINRLSRLTKALWDVEGNQIPVEYLVKTSPLPPIRENRQVIPLAHISVGPNGVFSFNQRPTAQVFKVEWWKFQPAQISVQLSNRDLSQKSFKSIEVEESRWSFYKLLQKGTEVEKNVWSWNISFNQKINARFEIEEPWLLFQIGNIHSAEIPTEEQEH